MINFAIVGCGHIAKKHAEAIERIEGAKLLNVCDKVAEQMDYFIEQYHAKGYTYYEEMLNNPDLDVVCICTPSGLHARLAIQAAAAKKHLVVEKPIALTLEDAEAIINAVNQHKVKLTVVHPNRFRPVMMAVKQIMDEGKLGKLSHVNATVRWNRNQEYYDQAPWRGTKALDGGVLMNQAIHNLDLMLWLTGAPEEVYSMQATRLRQIETEDVAVGTVRFQNGALGVVEAATTTYPQNLEETLSIFGEKGTLKIGGRTANWFEHIKVAEIDEHQANDLIETIKADPYGIPGHQCILEDMMQAIKENREPKVTGEDGKRALELVLALYQSAETNRPIKL